jgi:hypothetical protein
MMSGHTWKLMDWLAENNGKADCRIEMTTNLAYDTDTLNRFLDACSKVDVPIWLFTSGESTGACMEYVRDGINWELWNKNIDLVLNSGVIANTGICGTLSAASAPGFTKFLYWLADRKRTAPKNPNNSYSLMLSVNPVRFPTFQNIMVLPKHVREQYSNEIVEFLKGSDISQLFLPIEIDHINRYASYLKVAPPHQETHIEHTQAEYGNDRVDMDIQALQKDFKSFFTQYDLRRNKSYAATYPELAEWYNSI